ncbi:E3 ubiquitin-protein ligase Topors-like isoform X2 [Hemicordylus capensis]|nr:E3 ubiquitin-protein ligase Topors-like isoform X2 [Hemicordylus capensis]
MASETDDSSARSSPNRLHQPTSADASPDSTCPICLDQFEDVASLDSCRHRFCFRCVQEWSNTKAECPLCKQCFQTILHSLSAEDYYEEYIVRPSGDDAYFLPHGRRFYYETTLREPSSSRTFRTAFPPDEGVLFEGLLSQPARLRDSEMHPIIRCLVSRHQSGVERLSLRRILQQGIINYRRALYRSGIRVRNNPGEGPYRVISAGYFRSNPARLYRLIPWVKRELTVLYGARESLVATVTRAIMSTVARIEMESEAFTEYLKPFLLHCTEHFIHEFISFASGPCDIDSYDKYANYDCPAPSYEERRPPEPSIITISPNEADSQQPDRNAFTVGIGQAPWDDKTSGPSHSRSEQVCATISAALDTLESSDEEHFENTIEPPRKLPASAETNAVSGHSSHNCVSVGNVKPVAERTPGPFELSSYSKASAEGGKSEEMTQVQPIQCHLFSNTKASGSTSEFSVGSRADRYSYKSLSNQLKPKGREQDHTLSKSSPTKRDNDDDGYRLSRKRQSDVQDSHSRERHGLKRKRTHHNREKQKRKKDCSRHKHRKDKKKSRTRDKSLSRKSQTHSPSSESVMSRDQSRSRAHSETQIQHKKRKKRSRSPAVEDLSEGKATDARHHKKKRKRERETKKSHTGSPPFSSPVVTTIDSDSGKDTKIQESIECDSI